MFIDARSLDGNTVVETGVCIIGAGAAGITLARSLRSAGFPVAVLESGGFEYDEATQDLDAGDLAGVPNYPIDKSRLRYFGGTTNHWAGTCRPLDPLDFEARATIPLSGWPIRWADLLPWYEQAQQICELGPFNYEPDFWRKETGLEDLKLDPTRLKTAIFQISPPTRFGQTYREDLRQSDNVTVWLNANAVDLRTDPTASTVDHVRAACLGGPGFSVRARYVVLATGGLENARILLLSNRVQPAGLGNTHDLVGRYFMDHPYFPYAAVARYAKPNPSIPYVPPLPGKQVFATLATGDESGLPGQDDAEGIARFQILLSGSHRIIDGVDSLKTITSGLSHFAVPAHLWDHLGNILRDRDAVADSLYRTVTGRHTSPFPVRMDQDGPVTGAGMDILLEQAPSKDSRVTLSPERDALGQNRIILDWRLGEIERRTYRKAQTMVGLEFGRLGIGRVHATPLPDRGWPSNILGANHHMGTTRMSDDPKTGVVDAACRMHGVANLYVAGSSVFPTSGYANPTLTIVAMALRLGDELRRRMA
jgi:choline dehydrogenase-like flavoprotein